jgi:hypothetical protein
VLTIELIEKWELKNKHLKLLLFDLEKSFDPAYRVKHWKMLTTKENANN